MKEVLRKSIHKIKTKSRESLNELLYQTKLKQHLAPPNRRRIIVYHGVSAVKNTKISSKFISKKTMERQLVYFKRHFTILPLHEFLNLGDRVLDKFTISISFDDGYKNNYTHLLPLLEKHQIPATFFITAITDTTQKMLPGDFLDLATLISGERLIYEDQPFIKNWRGQYVRQKDGLSLKYIFHQSLFEEKLALLKIFPNSSHQFLREDKYKDFWQQMSPAEIIQVARSPYVTIGAHGYYHNDLSKLPLEHATREIKNSIGYLQNLTQQEIRDFAFPYGRYSDALVEACEQKNLSSALALQYLTPKRGSILRDRFGNNAYMSWNNQLHYLLKGNYGS